MFLLGPILDYYLNLIGLLLTCSWFLLGVFSVSSHAPDSNLTVLSAMASFKDESHAPGSILTVPNASSDWARTLGGNHEAKSIEKKNE